MKLRSLTFIVLLLLSAIASHASIIIPGADGSDGVLNITSDTVIDLSQAVTTNWNANNSVNLGKGVYDSNMWAVVFKYTDVTIAPNVTVTFSNHPSRAPVVWLVSGSVTVNGALSLNGQNYQGAPTLAEPGPGGFRGGQGRYAAGVYEASGLGIGGGYLDSGIGGGGSYGTAGERTPGPLYGNPSIIPLLGGSGGGGAESGNSGGGGGGAILIAAVNTITNNGEIRANGGVTYDSQYYGTHGPGGGSGGGIRLVCDRLVGTGTIRALGGYNGSQSIAGGLGRIRIERANNNNTITVVPDPSVVNLGAGDTALLWPPAGSPQARIVSIGGTNAPIDPRAAFGTIGADVVVPQNTNNMYQVVVETTNVEQASQVKVRRTPRNGANGQYLESDAAVASIVNANPLVIRWTADMPANPGYFAFQVHVIRP